MREPRSLTTLWAFIVCYRNNFTFFLSGRVYFTYKILRKETRNEEKLDKAKKPKIRKARERNKRIKKEG
jgi:hypothetical protein